MAIINNRSVLETDPLRNFRFLVTFLPQVDQGTSAGDGTEIIGKSTMGFTSVSGMAVTTDSIPYREGGYNTTVHQIPGQTTFAPITLQRGVMLGKAGNWNWMKKLFATVQGGGALKVGDNFRFDLEVAVLSHPVPAGGSEDVSAGMTAATGDRVAMRIHFYNCWPTSVAYSDLNAGDNALLVEQMALVHEGFDVHWAKNLTEDAPVFA
jgi:phage tail-like protein